MIKVAIEKYKNSTENNRIVINNVIGTFAVKGMALIVSLFTMPSYISFFHDNAVLGLWFTILSVISWILNFDFGIGNGLRNHLTQALAKKEYQEAKKYISSAYFSIGMICIIITAIGLMLFRFIPWNQVFRINEQLVSQQALHLTVIIVFVGIIVQLFLKLIQSILYALQKSAVNNFLTLCASIITLVMVNIIPSRDNDWNVICMAIIHALAVAIPLSVVTIVVFSRKIMRNLIPSIKYFSKQHSKQILTLGSFFLLVQILYMILTATNEYFVTFFSGTEEVVSFRIYNQLFLLGSTMFSLALTPIWSVVTKASAEKNYEWIKKLLKKLLLLFLLGTLCEFLIVPLLPVLIKLWLGEVAIEINYGYGIVFWAFASLIMLNSVLANIANGLGELRYQALFFALGVVIKLVLTGPFVSMTNSWIGVTMVSFLSMLPYCIVQLVYLVILIKKEHSNP